MTKEKASVQTEQTRQLKTQTSLAEENKRKHTSLSAGIAVIGVIAVIAVALLVWKLFFSSTDPTAENQHTATAQTVQDDVEVSPQPDKTPQKPTEADLKTGLEEKTGQQIAVWEFLDYNNDGAAEAFALTVPDASAESVVGGLYENGQLWVVSETAMIFVCDVVSCDHAVAIQRDGQYYFLLDTHTDNYNDEPCYLFCLSEDGTSAEQAYFQGGRYLLYDADKDRLVSYEPVYTYEGKSYIYYDLLYDPSAGTFTADMTPESYEVLLKGKLSQEISAPVIAWEYHDYDGDGTSEAFAITSEVEVCGHIIVYFVSGNTGVQVLEESYVYEDGGYSFTLSGRTFFVTRCGSMTGSGGDIIYSVSNGNAYELDISRLCQLKFDDSSGMLTGVSRGFWSPTFTSYVFEYDSSRGQFEILICMDEYIEGYEGPVS